MDKLQELTREFSKTAETKSIQQNLNQYHIDRVLKGLAPPINLSREYLAEMKSPLWSEEIFKKKYVPLIRESYNKDAMSVHDLKTLTYFLTVF